jgi:hypothetical protein
VWLVIQLFYGILSTVEIYVAPNEIWWVVRESNHGQS